VKTIWTRTFEALSLEVTKNISRKETTSKNVGILTETTVTLVNIEIMAALLSSHTSRKFEQLEVLRER
jgi:hypothetical protein